MSPRKNFESSVLPENPPERPQRTAPRPRRQVSDVAAPPERSKFMSAEEKHDLINYHASRQKAIDPMQRVALWVGVLVCAIAISGGWAYALRQSIANAVQSPTDRTLQDLGFGSSADSPAAKQFKSNMQDAMQRVGSLEEQSVAEMRTAAAVGQQVMQAATATAATPAGKNSGFPIPPGVKKD
jgi:hypothetical protein